MSDPRPTIEYRAIGVYVALALVFVTLCVLSMFAIDARMRSVGARVEALSDLQTLAAIGSRFEGELRVAPGVARARWPEFAAEVRERRADVTSPHLDAMTRVDERLRDVLERGEGLAALDSEASAEAIGGLSSSLARLRTEIADATRLHGAATATDLSVLATRWVQVVSLLVVACGVALVLGVVLVAHRRSDRRRGVIESAYGQSRAHLEQVLDQVPLVIWTTDGDLRFTASEGAGLAGIGRSAGDVNGMTLHEFFGQRGDGATAIDAHRRALSGEHVQYELTWEGRIFQADVRPLGDLDGRTIGCIGTAVDVTERRETIGQLQWTESRLARVLDRLPSVVPYETGGGREFVASTIVNLTGHTAEEHVANRELFPTLIHQDDVEAVTERVREWHRDGAPGKLSTQFRLRRPDGAYRWVEDRMRRVTSEDGVQTMTGVIIDITESKEAEEALQQSEESFRNVMEHIRDVFYLHDVVNRRLLYVSPAYESIWGESTQQLMENPSSWRDRIHPDDRVRVVETMERTRGRARYDEQYRIIDHDGRIRWIQDRGFPIHDANGRLTRLAGIAEDVTARKQAGVRFRGLLESAPDAMVIVDATGKIDLVNAQTEVLFGYRRSELLGQPVDVLIPEVLRASHGRLFSEYVADPRRRLLDEGRELPGRHRDGHEIPVEINLSPIEMEDGLLIVAAIRDVTGRRESERALRRSEQRFRELAENIPGTVYLCRPSPEHEVLYLNDSVETLTGYPKSGFFEEERSFRALCHAEDRPAVDQAMEARHHGNPYHAVYRIRHRDGSWRWVEEFGTSVRDEETGEVVYHEGFLHDVTERKQYEAERERRNQHERLLYRELDHRVRNNLAALIALVDLGAGHPGSVDEFARIIRGRIATMTSIHEMLTRSRATSMSIHRLIETVIPRELGDRVDLRGPDLPVPARQATAFAMVVHELLTNSLKYGSLGVPAGTVILEWIGAGKTEEGLRVTWSWREHGGPHIEVKPIDGVGTRLVRGLVRSDLRGHAELAFPPQGATHEFMITLAREEDEVHSPGIDVIIPSQGLDADA